MAGVGKLMKQMKKMQQEMDTLQEELATRELEVSSGGGAVTVKVNAQGEFLGLKIDPEFLKEEAVFVEEAILEAVQEAASKARKVSEEEMSRITAGMGLPGMGM